MHTCYCVRRWGTLIRLQEPRRMKRTGLRNDETVVQAAKRRNEKLKGDILDQYAFNANSSEAAYLAKIWYMRI